jgi:hypothetical protein
MTDAEKRNIERVKYWEWAWNTEVDRMVDECYDANCEVVNMLTGHTMRGREELRKIEHAMLAFDAKRKMQVRRVIASGAVVALEADAFWHGKKSSVCVFLTFNKDGLIVSDHSYGADPSGASSTRDTPGALTQQERSKVR